ncbi:MAG: DUF6382 domain-containing protein [Lachnospiraceae bacterium]
MEYTYKKDLQNSFLVVKGQEVLEDYQYKIFKSNKIQGLLEGKEVMKYSYYFNISGLTSFEDLYQEKQLSYKEISNFFYQLQEMIQTIKGYFLSEKKIILQPEFIYKDVETQKIFFLFLPWLEERYQEGPFQNLAEFFLQKTDHKDSMAVNVSYYFYKKQKEKNFSLFLILSFLENENKIKYENEAKDEKETIEICKLEEDKEDERDESIEKNVVQKIKQFFLNYIKKSKCDLCEIEEETEEIPIRVSYEDHEKTVFFTNKEEEYIKLTWIENGKEQEVSLEKFPIIIGKSEHNASLIIKDPSVSRKHCEITKNEELLFIRDLNSTNGTYVNDIPLWEMESIPIQKGDRLLIGKVTLNVV